jgi:hypothetical protein
LIPSLVIVEDGGDLKEAKPEGKPSGHRGHVLGAVCGTLVSFTFSLCFLGMR